MKDKIYLVGIMTGDYDEFSTKEVFITKDKKVATKWYDRFNEIRLKALNLYSANTEVIHGDWDETPTLLTRWFNSQHKKWAHTHPFIQDMEER